MDVMEKARRHIAEHDALARLLKIEALEIGPGYGKARMPLEDIHRNGAGVAHGGALYTLADIALALAANSDGRMALGISGSITYMRPGLHGPLTAEAREIGGSSRLGHYNMEIRDGRGELIAVMRGSTYKKNAPFPPEAAVENKAGDR